MRENREIVLSEQEIQEICNDFGKKLSKDLENEERTPLFLGVMKGALNFMFDLIKRIDRPIFTDFIQISSYAGVQTTGKINLKKDFDMDIGIAKRRSPRYKSQPAPKHEHQLFSSWEIFWRNF